MTRVKPISYFVLALCKVQTVTFEKLANGFDTSPGGPEKALQDYKERWQNRNVLQGNEIQWVRYGEDTPTRYPKSRKTFAISNDSFRLVL